MSQITKIKSIEHVTHDVLRIVLDKPQGLNYIPGQAVDISLNKPKWSEKKNCFTFTSLPEDDHIEFTIKTYPEHKGMTNELLSSKPGDEVLIYSPFGDIYFKGAGIFIAGGAGITPFIAILKSLEKQNKIEGNKLIFANKHKADIILEAHYNALLGKNFINVLSKEEIEGYEHGYISEQLIKKYSEDNLKYYYLCGPPPMMNAVEGLLKTLGIAEEFIVKEGF
ncbi:FAD-binding oxidoreductase [Kaistella jeonii]|uniref:Flavodoxin reductase n=1 Tax=Kaistella jeonii TaxID=266749 RepID=A0A0C1D329_9FLAO|nr:FAD-binding oxidoreductase [Kaistella jeonii]KIA88195.1 flavodoxin reductase [Kaistella jeonii]SFC25560.1 Ferredoxin-NADP reductase [Kaistella jeonii]VEI95657.1 Benzoate 1,2-dioxygenase electron transfer component [Kaistella jeonii]